MHSSVTGFPAAASNNTSARRRSPHTNNRQGLSGVDEHNRLAPPLRLTTAASVMRLVMANVGWKFIALLTLPQDCSTPDHLTSRNGPRGRVGTVRYQWWLPLGGEGKSPISLKPHIMGSLFFGPSSSTFQTTPDTFSVSPVSTRKQSKLTTRSRQPLLRESFRENSSSAETTRASHDRHPVPRRQSRQECPSPEK